MKNLNFLVVLMLACCMSLTSYGQKKRKSGDEAEMIVKSSPFGVDSTLNLIRSRIQENGLTIFSEMNHAEEAKKVGFDLKPISLIVFGNPWVGTQLMNCDPRVGIALPLKILVWRDNESVKVGYYDALSLDAAYDLESCANILKTINGALTTIVSFEEL